MLLWYVAGTASAPVPPAFDGSYAYFLRTDHTVIALEAQSGRQLWTGRTDSGATVAAGSYAGCVAAGSVVACGDNGDVVALRRSDGTFVWRFHPNGCKRPDYSPFFVRDTIIYTGSAVGGCVFALSAGGALLWTGNVNDPTVTLVLTPAADTDIVVVPYQRPTKTGGVIGLDARTGQTRWMSEFPQPSPDTQATGAYVALSQKFVFGSANNGRIFALDRLTGAIQWNIPGIVNRVYDERGLAVSGQQVIATSDPGWVAGYDVGTGKENWRTNPGIYDSYNGVRADAQYAYAWYLTGAVASFNLSDGHLHWIAGGSPGPLRSFAVGSDQIFAAGTNGYYAYAK